MGIEVYGYRGIMEGWSGGVGTSSPAPLPFLLSKEKGLLVAVINN